MESHFRTVLAVGILTLVVIACGGSGSATSAPQTSSASGPPASAAAPTGGQACTTDATEGDEVIIVNFTYQPAQLTVPVGSAVAWTNNDTDAHTVTFDNGPDCGRMDNDDTVALDFDTVGTFSYFCAFHPNMRAEIVVE